MLVCFVLSWLYSVLCCLTQFGTNLNLIKFFVLFCGCARVSFSVLCSLMQMSPTKHAAPKRSSSKRARIDSDNFRFAKTDMKYNDCYKDKTIIIERVVQMESLEDTFIPKVFKDKTWTKLLNLSGVVYSEIIKEFSNAGLDENHIDCRVRHKEFVISRESIQNFLEVRPPSQPIIVQYEDRLDSIEEMIRILGGTSKKSSMNTIPFTLEMRTLGHVMIHNLYSITNLITLSALRTIFLYDFFTHKEIDICGHIFHILKKSIEK